MRWLTRLFALVLVSALWSASARADVQAPGKSVAPESSMWRKKLGTFRIGIVGGNRAGLRTRQSEPFRRVVEKTLNMPVEIFTARDHSALVEALVASRIEYAVLSGTSYAAAWRVCKCVEPLVAPAAANGTTSFRSVLITRSTGPNSLGEAAGGKILVPGRQSFAGYLYPRAQLAAEGHVLGGAKWPLTIEKGAEQATTAFLGGSGDALFGWEAEPVNGEAVTRGTRATLAGGTGSAATDYQLVWRSKPVPHGPHTVRSALDSEAKDLLSEFLLTMNETDPAAYDAIEPFLGGGFKKIAAEAYKPVIRALDYRMSPQEALRASLLSQLRLSQ